MKSIFIVLLILGAVQFGFKYLNIDRPKSAVAEKKVVQGAQNQTAPKSSRSYTTPKSGQQFSGSGRVTRVLSDDTTGSRHQRFIITLPSGQTLLIAHNIDIAPRVSGLQTGDTISFNGVYESNSKGGVVHWTHHDPSGRHTAGWLKKNGRTYQ
jgi:hypothetical protein